METKSATVSIFDVPREKVAYCSNRFDSHQLTGWIEQGCETNGPRTPALQIRFPVSTKAELLTKESEGADVASRVLASLWA